MLFASSTVSPLRTHLQVTNSQRGDCASDSRKELKLVRSTSDTRDTAARPPSPTADHPSALPYPTSSPHSAAVLVCPLDASPCPAVVLDYCTFPGTVL